jgi:hypothetical protein
MEDGGWRMEDGGWKMENGKWKMEDGELRSTSAKLMENCAVSRASGKHISEANGDSTKLIVSCAAIRRV